MPLASIVVVDHGSAPEAAAQLDAAVREVAGERPVSSLRAGRSLPVEQALLLGLEAARGDLVLLVSDETEVPPSPGTDVWLEGLVWLLEDKQAASASPTLVGRGELGHDPLAEPRRLAATPEGCALVRRTELLRALVEGEGPLGTRLAAVTDRTPWSHPVQLVHARGEARRVAGTFAAAPGTPLPASVVLVAYDGIAYTRAAIEAVLSHTRPPFELVLVDNGSKDGTRALFAEVERAVGGGVAVQVVTNPENRGYPVAANQGVRAARGRDVVLLNNDTRVRPGWLAALLDAARAKSDVGLVTAKVLNEDGTVQSAGGIEHRPDGSFTIPFTGEDRLAPPVERRRAVDNAGGPCLLVTRRAIEALAQDGALFDEAYSPAYFEDSNLCLRAREAGLTLLYEPRAELVHVGKATANLVAREGRLDVWRGFEANKARFYSRWADRLAADEVARRGRDRPAPRRRVLLLSPAGPGPAGSIEAALRREHDVVTAGLGQELDLAWDAPANLLLALATERFEDEVELVLLLEGGLRPPGLEELTCPTAYWAIGQAAEEPPRVAHRFAAQRSAQPRLGARWLPLAADPALHRAHGSAEDLDVLVVGDPNAAHPRRAALVERLARHFRVTVAPEPRPAEAARLYGRARVVWHCATAGALEGRVFEALAAGACLAVERAGNGLLELFEDEGHLAVWDEERLEEVVAGLLADGPRRARLAERGRRLVLGHHTWSHRARELVEVALAAVGQEVA